MTIKILPAYNGDCILLSYDFENAVKNILIDGGPPRTYNHALKNELIKLSSLGQSIDLLIITHIDDDHIGGIKRLYEDVKFDKSLIKEVWFNSGKLLSSYFNARKDDSRNVKIISNDTTLMSVRQGNSLESQLEKVGHWNRNIIKAGDTKNIFGAAVTVLSPGITELEKLNEKWETQKHLRTEMSIKKNDWDRKVEELLVEKFCEDVSIPNGSSIAILVNIGHKKILLMGDAHPSVVADQLNKMGYRNDSKLSLDALKLSHHGSRGNTSDHLLSFLECEKFIISTDGTSHRLPHKETLAKIVSKTKKPKLYFNYVQRFQNIFTQGEKINYDIEILSTEHLIL